MLREAGVQISITGRDPAEVHTATMQPG
jgi:hypothetical protein